MHTRDLISFTLMSNVLLALASGCATEETDPAAQEFRTTPAQCNPPCDLTGNSPEINDFAVDELYVDGNLLNSDGVSVRGIRAPGGSDLYNFGTFGQELAAYDGATKLAHGGDLSGYEIVLMLDSEEKVATIEYVERSASWATNGDDVLLYAISYHDPAVPDGPVSVCPGFDFDETVVTVLVGETYDRDAKTVHSDPGWITLACQGEAAYKMKMMNYAPLQDFDGFGNSVSAERRQATLKMITADYCGGGTSYTQQGTLVAWENPTGSVSFTPPIWSSTQIEAVWGPDGAKCLGTRRLSSSADPFVECPSLPICDPDDLPDGDWITRVEAPDTDTDTE